MVSHDLIIISVVLYCFDIWICSQLSPTNPYRVIWKKLHSVTVRDGGFNKLLDPANHGLSEKYSLLWWNLVVLFRRHKLPITFLLQASFKERLIMPMPEM